jgi:osmotically-inducible protein OsmY
MDDKTLRQQLIDELDFEPSIDSANIGVAVDDGVVTLTGHAPTYAQKTMAANVAKRIKGVRAIVQEIDVRPPFAGEGDEDIARRALNVISWDVTIPRDAIKVQVAHGFVTLTGEVDWDYQRRAAEHDVRKLSGVVGVANAIAIKAKTDEGDIKRRIEDALERNADIEASGVSVEVKDGRVILQGKVRAWYERDVLERAAWSAPGVKSVEDHITVTA